MNTTEIPFNILFDGIPVSSRWTPFDPTTIDTTNPDDVARAEMYSQPSGLTKVKLPCYGLYVTVDFTGTTNDEALKKLLDFYARPGALDSIGDHIYFEGFSRLPNGTYMVHFGS